VTGREPMTTPDQGRGGALRQELAHFTDREPYLEAFRGILAVPDGTALRVLAFHGVGGVGKTTLIERLGHELDGQKPPIPHARFNVENLKSPASAAREILLKLRSDLESGYAMKFPRFDLLLAVLLTAEGGTPPPLVSLNPGLKNLFDFTMGLVGVPSDMIGKVLHGQASKSETAARLLARAGGREELFHLRERARREDPTLADELIDRFADDLVAALAARPGKACRGVLFLDTFETLWKGSDAGRSVQARRLDAWLRQLAIKVRERGVLIVVAGRDELRWAEDEADWNDAIETHLLGGLSRHDAQIYLAKRSIGPSPWTSETPLQSAILDACSGAPGPDGEVSCHPFFLALCAAIVDNSRAKYAGADPPIDTFIGLPSDQVAKKLADLFLKSLPNERWELWVKELSLTPSFDERAALDLDRGRHHNLGRVGWEQLCRYSFLESQPDGFFRVHKTMRDVLRTRLGGKATDVHAWFRDHWTGRDEPSLAFFHRWSLDPEATLKGWSEEHEAALKDGRIGAARALLDEWSEISLDGVDRQHLGDRLWARTHYELGSALRKTPLAPRAPSLNAAIGHFDSALQVFTEAKYPLDWAATQNNLGGAYSYLPTGDRGANLDRAIECYKAALPVFTRAGFQYEWAIVQNNLGTAYRDLLTGNRGANLDRAINCYQAALGVFAKLGFWSEWAMTQNNLGNVYRDLPTGDRGANLDHAIKCYEAALLVYTKSAFPSEWAMVQNNLGIAYSELPTGDRGENLGHAIKFYHAALEVYTESDFPSEWARAQNSLGNVCGDPAILDHGATLSRAIECYAAALRVYTESDFPGAWAMTQNNLGFALRELGKLNESVHAFEFAVRGFERVGDGKNAEKARIEAERSRLMKGPQTET
jgi:tetratricopeptide (TPR) repeat protein